MSANAFRSPLMQHFASAAKSQHRPPLVLSRFCSSTSDEKSENMTRKEHPSNQSLSVSGGCHIKASNVLYSDGFLSTKSKERKDPRRLIHSSSERSDQPLHHFSTLQSQNAAATDHSIYEIIRSRRTSVLGPINTPDLPHLRDSITKAIELATYGPNHRRTEPTTYYRIFSNTLSSNKLANICYNVSLCCNIKSKSIEDATSNAEDKKNKWLSTVACYIAVTCSNQPIQDVEPNEDYKNNSHFSSIEPHNENEFHYWFHPLSIQYPETERQLEDYASSCASIQNLLLSLHADNYGSKWATGPLVRSRAFRSLLGCKQDELVVGLIMVGTPKFVPTKPWRRRRDLDGDVLRDL